MTMFRDHTAGHAGRQAGLGLLCGDGNDQHSYGAQTCASLWGWAGYSTSIEIISERDFAIVVATSKSWAPLWDARWSAIQAAANLPAIAPRHYDELDPVELDTDVGTYVDDWGQEHLVELAEGRLRLSGPGCDLNPVAPRQFQCDEDGDGQDRWDAAATFLLDESGAVEWLRVDQVLVARKVAGGDGE